MHLWRPNRSSVSGGASTAAMLRAIGFHRRPTPPFHVVERRNSLHLLLGIPLWDCETTTAAAADFGGSHANVDRFTRPTTPDLVGQRMNPRTRSSAATEPAVSDAIVPPERAVCAAQRGGASKLAEIPTDSVSGPRSGLQRRAGRAFSPTHNSCDLADHSTDRRGGVRLGEGPTTQRP